MTGALRADAEQEMQSLASLQRLAKADTLDDLIASGLATKQKQKKELADTSGHLRKLRKRKASIMLAMAGMTSQKLEDMKAAMACKERRREEKKAAARKKAKVKVVLTPDEVELMSIPKSEAQASTGHPETQEEAAEERALAEAVAEVQESQK